jgi:beta-glucosidase
VSSDFRFAEDFLWGTATAAYQIENTQPDDWAAFERDAVAGQRFAQLGPGRPQPGHIHRLGDYSAEIRQKKSDFDSHLEADLAMAAAMKHNAYRFSISWARLFPTAEQSAPEPSAIDFYRRIFAALAKHKMQPLVTLFHFTSPAWLWQEQAGQRGWERPDALLHWERFVRAVLAHFGDCIRIYCTLNEPMVYVYAGYLDGVFPPLERRKSPLAIVPVVVRLLEAHALAYRLIKSDAARRGIETAVGFAQHTRIFAPLRRWQPLDHLTARLIARAFIWDFCDAVDSGVFRLLGLGKGQPIAGLRGSQDYLGVNYYGRYYVKARPLHDPKFEVLLHHPQRRTSDRPNDLGWASYADGFRQLLTQASRRYRLPIYVLENGTADAQPDDRLRRQLLIEHVDAMAAAQRHGADIRGYFHWSLIDNFEWAEGFEARFGLVAIDYQNGFARRPRPSAALYTKIIEQRGSTAGLIV